MNGVEVEEFSVGFGPRILSTKPAEGKTRYSLKLLLFGGSCRMKGMMDFEEDEENTVPVSAQKGAFRSVSIGRRAAIVFAGPLFNFILAWICAVIVLSVVGYDPAVIVSVTRGSAAEEAGLCAGDVITEFNGEHVDIGRDVETWFMFHDLSEDTEVTVKFRRDGSEYTAVYYPGVSRYMLGFSYMMDAETAEITAVSEGSPLEEAGVLAGDIITKIDGCEITTAESLYNQVSAHPLTEAPVTLELDRGGERFEVTVVPVSGEVTLGFSTNLGRVNTSAIGVLKYSLIELRYWIGTTVRSVGALFTGRYSVDDLSGPVGVVDMVGQTYEEVKSEGALMTWMNMINLIILLSANLGVMNLLPIPAIDGGKLLFLLIEAIRGKPVDQNVEAAIQTAAAVALMALMVYIMYHDIVTILP